MRRPEQMRRGSVRIEVGDGPQGGDAHHRLGRAEQWLDHRRPLARGERPEGLEQPDNHRVLPLGMQRDGEGRGGGAVTEGAQALGGAAAGRRIRARQLADGKAEQALLPVTRARRHREAALLEEALRLPGHREHAGRGRARRGCGE